MLAVAKGPSSMLHPDQGFQFGIGGDQDTTPEKIVNKQLISINKQKCKQIKHLPASVGTDSGSKLSRFTSVNREIDSVPSEKC